MVNVIQLQEDNMVLKNEVARLRVLAGQLARDIEREVEITSKCPGLRDWHEYKKGLRR